MHANFFRWIEPKSLWIFEDVTQFHPLPQGEGRGEGEGDFTNPTTPIRCSFPNRKFQ